MQHPAQAHEAWLSCWRRSAFFVHLRTCLGLINARSLSNNAELITSYIIDLGLDFLGMTETWLNSENGDGIIKSVCPDGYSALLLPRPNRRGVGLELIHKTSIEVRRPARPPPLIQPTSFECIDLSLVFQTRRVRFLLVYRLPSSSTACFDEFSSILEVISVTSDRLHIVGDFNFHGESESNSAEYPSLQFNHKVEGKLYIFK